MLAMSRTILSTTTLATGPCGQDPMHFVQEAIFSEGSVSVVFADDNLAESVSLAQSCTALSISEIHSFNWQNIWILSMFGLMIVPTTRSLFVPRLRHKSMRLQDGPLKMRRRRTTKWQVASAWP